MQSDNFEVMFRLPFLGYYTDLIMLGEWIYFALSCCSKSRLIMVQSSKSVLLIAVGWDIRQKKKV